MRMNFVLATAALLFLSPGMMLTAAVAADDSIEPAVDQICGAIANVCLATCNANDPTGEYPALTSNCEDKCLAEEDVCIGDYNDAPAKGTMPNIGGVPSGGAVLDADPGQSQNQIFFLQEWQLLTPDQ